MDPLLILSVLLGFFLTLFSMPIWIKRAKKAGLVGKDVHKLDKREVAEAGGISVVFGFTISILFYVALRTFYFKNTESLISTFGLLTTIMIVGFIGFVDDILGWKIGMNRKMRIFLLIFGAIPLMVINAGESTMLSIEFGILYPLLLIPLGIVGASATYNFLAGYNGLETSQGIIILSGLAFVLWKSGNSTLALISLLMVASLLAFYLFNKYPAKAFPGDSLTYPIGALIACLAILGNIEKIAVFFFIPYIIETILKTRGKLRKESFLKLNSDGSLDKPYDKFYGLGHVAVATLKKIKNKVYEREVVYLINAFQILTVALGILLFL